LSKKLAVYDPTEKNQLKANNSTVSVEKIAYGGPKCITFAAPKEGLKST
jgi:hypothetical protein